MAKAKRTKFEVVPRKNGWQVNYRTPLHKLKPPRDDMGQFLGGPFVQKTFAVKYAVLWARANQPSQLFIKGRDGKIQDERTYGDDPRRTKG